MTSRNRPGQNSLLANCMTQTEREGKARQKRETERRKDVGRKRDREKGSMRT